MQENHAWLSGAPADRNASFSAETDPSVHYSKCDVRNWEEQKAAFKLAVEKSHNGFIDNVIANAGISGDDPFYMDLDAKDIQAPDMKIVDIDLTGAMYTVRLALNHWLQHPEIPMEDKCLILKSSVAGYLDSLPSYGSAKFGVLAIMRATRNKGICRSNLVAPWFIATTIMLPEVQKKLDAQLKQFNSDWDLVEAAVKCVLRISTDTSIHGPFHQTPLPILFLVESDEPSTCSAPATDPPPRPNPSRIQSAPVDPACRRRFLIGSDIAGTVEAIGSAIPSTSPFRPGVRILAFATTFVHGGEPAYGASQEKVIIPVESACPIPDTLSFVDAATMPMGVITAWSGFTSIGLKTITTALYKPEDKQGLLIWGASSSMGMSTIQVAKTLGFTIYATSSAKHHATLIALGASKVFDYKAPTVVEDIISAATSDGVALKTAYRAIGAIQPILDILAAFGGGALASAIPVDATTPSHPSVTTKFVMAPPGPEAEAKHLEFVFQEWLAPRLVEGSYIAAPRARVLPGGLGALNEGLDILKGGVSGEKLVVEV